MTTITQTKVLRRKGAVPPNPTVPQAAEKADIWSTLSEPGTVTNLKGVLFGPPKSGKTVTSLRGWPDQEKLLVLTEPEGDLPIYGRKDVKVLRPNNYREMSQIIEGLHTKMAGRWPTVVFDSVSFMTEIIGGKDINQTYLDNKDVRRAYGKAGAAVNQLIHDAVALPMNVIFTAQMRSEQPSEESVPLIPEEGKYPLTLAVTPMVYGVLVPAVSFIGRTYKTVGYSEKVGNKPAQKQVEYWTSFEDFGKSPAGSRLPIPPQVRDLDLQDLLASLTKEA